ncbi:MAG: hypothetical protein ACK4M6_09320 [Hyphomonas sp.]
MLTPAAVAEQTEAAGRDLAGECEADEAAACMQLGERLYLGLDAQADIPAALTLFSKACELGLGEACSRLGGELEFPDFGEPAPEGAQAAYTRACALGLADACDRAGIEEQAAPEPQTADVPLPPPATGSADTNADKDAPVIVAPTALVSEDAALTETSFSAFGSEALPDLDFGIERADLEPEAPLPEGEGPPATDAEETEPGEPTEEALLAEERREMANACGRGDMEACEIFAAWLRDGTGGTADPVRARRIFSVICTEGSVMGCYELGWMMYDAGLGSGSGLDTDELEISRARFLFSETCKAGVIEACIQGADMRRNGVGGRVDEDGAGRLYAIACEAGLEIGCLMAGPEEAIVDVAAESNAESGVEAALLEDDTSAD